MVETERLALTLMNVDCIEAFLAGDRTAAGRILNATVPTNWPDADDTWLLGLRREQIEADASVAPWLLRALIRKSDRHMIGYFNFHGGPDERGVVEVGYQVWAKHRRRGYAEETVRGMFAWAHRTHGVARFRASVSPENAPSLAMVAKLGFVQVGEQWDEIDGRELVFEMSYPKLEGTV